MSRSEALLRKVRHLANRCAYLRKMQTVSRTRFMKNQTLQLAIERALQEAIEACLDIGRMMLSDVRVGLPDTNRGVFLALVQHGLAASDRVEAWVDMAGFRNVLVHGYDDVDVTVVYQVLHNRLDDLEAFGRAALARLPEEPGDPPADPAV